jgi:hypothetical protein
MLEARNRVQISSCLGSKDRTTGLALRKIHGLVPMCDFISAIDSVCFETPWLHVIDSESLAGFLKKSMRLQKLVESRSLVFRSNR